MANCHKHDRFGIGPCPECSSREPEFNRLCDELLHWLDLRYANTGAYPQILARQFEQHKLTFRTFIRALLEVFTS